METGLAEASGEARQEQGNWDKGNCEGNTLADQAAARIEGEAIATGYLGRLRAEQATVDELAEVISALEHDTLRGFCRTLRKALEVRHA